MHQALAPEHPLREGADMWMASITMTSTRERVNFYNIEWSHSYPTFSTKRTSRSRQLPSRRSGSCRRMSCSVSWTRAPTSSAATVTSGDWSGRLRIPPWCPSTGSAPWARTKPLTTAGRARGSTSRVMMTSWVWSTRAAVWSGSNLKVSTKDLFYQQSKTNIHIQDIPGGRAWWTTVPMLGKHSSWIRIQMRRPSIMSCKCLVRRIWRIHSCCSGSLTSQTRLRDLGWRKTLWWNCPMLRARPRILPFSSPRLWKNAILMPKQWLLTLSVFQK